MTKPTVPYQIESFNAESKLCQFHEAERTSPILLQFDILRGARDYTSFKAAVYEFAENSKRFYAAGVFISVQNSPGKTV